MKRTRDQSHSNESFPLISPARQLPKSAALNALSNVDELEYTNCSHCNYRCHFKIPIFLPVGRTRSIWNTFLFVLLVYSVILIPYELAFDVVWNEGNCLSVVELLIDLCLTFDVLLNFRVKSLSRYPLN